MCSSLGKRKAETTQSMEESDGSDSSGEGEMETSSAEMSMESEDDNVKEWEWGYDSFEDKEYESPIEDIFSDEESNQKLRRYKRQLYEHKRFYIQRENIMDGQLGAIWPYPEASLDSDITRNGTTMRVNMGDTAKEAIEIYNQINGTNVAFEKVVRVTHARLNALHKFYITVLAKENPDGPLVEYQVKAQRIAMERNQPIFCRPSEIE